MDTQRTGILFVHGIQGSPGQFRFLTDRLPEGIHVRNILLPGHGAGAGEFRRSGRRAWLSAVERAAGELRAECARLLFVGHSMGCLLGLMAQRGMPAAFSGMIMICCPFSIRPTFRYVKYGVLSSFPNAKSGDPFVEAARLANGVRAEDPLQYLTCAHPYAELLRLIREARRDLPRPECGKMWFFSERDEIVSTSSARFAEEIGGEIRTLEGCGHNYFTEQGKEILAQALLDMLRDT